MASLMAKVMVAVWPVVRLAWSLVIAIVGGVVSCTALTTMSKVSLTFRPSASVRVTVTVVVPAVVGVPLKVPEAASKVNQAGSVLVV